MKRLITLLFMVALAQPFYANFYHLLIGTYTDTGKSQGIYSYDVDMTTATIIQRSVATGVSNPSYLAITPDKKFVYSVNESNESSAANAFSFDKNTARLMFINRSSTDSPGPCYISVTNKHVITANYKGGSISVFGRNSDGSLTNILQKIQHTGSSINKARQNEPHVHQVLVSPDKKYVIANDLGTDKVTVYKYNTTSDVLFPFDTLSVKPGSGPRHAIFSKNGKKLYLLHEIDGTVSVITFKKGKLNLIQETSVVSKNEDKAWAGDIHLSPDGKYLYATNRAPANDITCFSVARNGKLEFLQQISTFGDGPRNFAITPDGRYLFVGHQFSDEVVIFKRNVKTGLLTDSGMRIGVGAPVCLVFY